MSFLKVDPKKNLPQLDGSFAKCGYDWWWHSFTGKSEKTGKERAFFIEFFTVNPALSKDEVVLGQDPENKESGKKPSYLMIKCGCWGKRHFQFHKFFPWKDVKMDEKTLCIKAGDCILTEDTLKGTVEISEDEAEDPARMTDAGTMTFDLKIEKHLPFNVGYGTSSLFRKMKAFEMYWHVSGMKTAYFGTVTVNGKKFTVEKESSFGYADKNWGADFTTPWLWLSSNHIYSEKEGRVLKNSAFDIGGGRPKAFHIRFNRKLLSAICYEGTPLEFNFSKFWTFTRTYFDCYETDTDIVWKVRQENLFFVHVTEIKCPKKEMLFVNYETPKGEKKFNKLWNGGTGFGRVKLYRKKYFGKKDLIDTWIVRNVGCEWGEE